METARELSAFSCQFSVHFIFRAGVWKPRTRPETFQGVGEPALAWLQEVKRTYGVPVATEVATPEHVEAALKAGIDYLWIGARTSASPIAVSAIGSAIEDWRFEGDFYQKSRESGCRVVVGEYCAVGKDRCTGDGDPQGL